MRLCGGDHRSRRKDDLRARWCKTFGKEPPPALTKDLLGRMIAWRIQEKFYGGHDKATIKLLDGLVRGEAEKLEAGPRLKPGTVLMREHRGVRHTVTLHDRQKHRRMASYGQGTKKAPPTRAGQVRVWRILV